MTEKIQNGNLRMAIVVGGFLVTIATIVFATGTLKGEIMVKVDHNTSTIGSHYESGCKPSIDVRRDVAVLKSSLARMESKLDKIADKL